MGYGPWRTLLLLTVGCGAPGPVSLANSNPEHLRISTDLDPDLVTLRAVLKYDAEGCPPLDEVTATFGDAALTTVPRNTYGSDPTNQCNPEGRWEKYSFPRTVGTTFTLTDETGSIALDVPTFYADRTPVLDSPGPYRPGSQLQVLWTVQDDLVKIDEFDLADSAGRHVLSDQPQLVATHFGLHIPEVFAEGKATLFLRTIHILKTSPCPLSRCEVSQGHLATLTFDIAAR